MKTTIVLASLLATMITLDVSAQRAEYDDMYFTAKDREKNKAIQAEESRTPAKVKKQQQVEEDEYITEEVDTNPLDSYSARNVNPEYVSRANSEEASADEENYFVEGYSPTPAGGNFNYNNSYYNNSNWARNSYYAANGWYSPYGMGMYDPWMMNNRMYSPYGYGMGYGFYDPWMSPYGGYGMGMGSGWSMSIGYGWGNNFGWGGYPYYGGGYSNIWYGNNYYGGGYYYEPSKPNTNYGRRPSRNSAVVAPSQRTVSRSRTSEGVATTGGRVANTNNNTTTRVRTRQTQDEYYVRPAQRATRSSDSFSRPSSGNSYSNPGTTPSRSREYSSPSRSTSPAYTPSPSRSSSPSYSPSPSRSSGGGSSGGSGGGGTRSRGRN